MHNYAHFEFHHSPTPVLLVTAQGSVQQSPPPPCLPSQPCRCRFFFMFWFSAERVHSYFRLKALASRAGATAGGREDRVDVFNPTSRRYVRVTSVFCICVLGVSVRCARNVRKAYPHRTGSGKPGTTCTIWRVSGATRATDS